MIKIDNNKNILVNIINHQVQTQYQHVLVRKV